MYPLSLEPYTLDLLPRLRQTASIEHQKHLNYLSERQAAIESKKREEMRRVAPGWNGAWDALQPEPSTKHKQQTSSSFDDGLVDGLDKLST